MWDVMAYFKVFSTCLKRKVIFLRAFKINRNQKGTKRSIILSYSENLEKLVLECMGKAYFDFVLAQCFGLFCWLTLPLLSELILFVCAINKLGYICEPYRFTMLKIEYWVLSWRRSILETPCIKWKLNPAMLVAGSSEKGNSEMQFYNWMSRTERKKSNCKKNLTWTET